MDKGGKRVKGKYISNLVWLNDHYC